MTKINDNNFIGNKFGRLTILERKDIRDKNGKNKIYYRCDCDCGNKDAFILRYSIYKGDAQSCGCLRNEHIQKLNSQDLVGKIFTRLKVIKKVEKPKTKKEKGNFWLCQCMCGSEKQVIVSTRDLNSSNTKSCGCLNLERLIKFNKETKKKYNTYNLTGEYGVGYTFKNEPFYFDLEDYNLIKDYCWYTHKDGYIATTIEKDSKDYTLLLHRLITDCPEDKEVDHINGKPSRNDNRKYNIRICEHQKNMCNYTKPKNNTSGVKGVSYCNTHDVWKAYITADNERMNLGSYNNFDSAVKARQEAEDIYHGEYKWKGEN
jgi:hypothetical protein